MTTMVERVVSPETARAVYGGLDAFSKVVDDCEKLHGEHHKWSPITVDYRSVMGDLVTMYICARCYVRKCDASVLEPDAVCIWPVHHMRPHRDERGRWREVTKRAVVDSRA